MGNRKQFRTGLSLGILAFLLGGPAIAGIVFLFLELLNLTAAFAKWIFTVTPLLLLLIPLLFWKKGRSQFMYGYYMGIVSCFFLTYAVVRLLAWGMTIK